MAGTKWLWYEMTVIPLFDFVHHVHARMSCKFYQYTQEIEILFIYGIHVVYHFKFVAVTSH